jgi:peptidoglycan-N-acetylglucosamine deacetylase
VSFLDLTHIGAVMSRTRIAAAVAVFAAGLFLLGCGAGDATKASWHAAPAAGAGGGEAVDGSLVLTQTSATTAPAPPSASGVPGVLTTTGSEAVALTFDDGPDATYTPLVLKMLREHQVKATFCLVGVQVQENPQLVRDIVADGHTLCNHTWKHDMNLGNRSEDAIRTDLQRTTDAILAAAPGAAVKYFRHPGGKFTPRAVAVAAAMGMKSAGWEVDTSDWNVAKYHGGTTMRDHVLSVLRTQVKPGSIVLAHDAGGDRSGTLAAFQAALPELLAKYQLTALP